MMISTMAPRDHFNPDGTIARQRLASAGRPTPLTQLAVMDDDGRLLPPGERGEIVVRGSLVMEGYYKNPQATAEVSRFGCHHTGDIGYLDEEGYVYLTDRATFMIVSGGVNIYPQESENLLVTHPKVADAAVFGIPHSDLGEEVKAVVQLMPGVEPSAETEAELVDFCRRQLAHLKCPRSIDFTAELPRLPTGKLYKRLLRDRYWGNTTSRIV